MNHLTLAVRELSRSVDFYQRLLGFRPVARWRTGAYLELGSLWLCLSVDDLKSPGPAPDYTHYAFTIAQEHFGTFAQRLSEQGIAQWKENRSEGDSLYFLDPDGHKLEAHVGGLAERMAQCRASPYADMEFLE